MRLHLPSSCSAASLPDAKRVRIAREDDFSPREAVPRLLESSDLPASLLSIGPAGNNLDKLRQLLDNHGFRTAKISSPRQGISVYKDSFQQYEGNDEGKNFLIAMFGLHPDQVVMEKIYEKEVKKPYCLLLFCRRLREICHRAMKNPKLAKQVIDTERNCRSFETKTEETRQYLSSLEQVTAIIQLAVQVDSRLRPEQLQREYDCIDVWNSTLSNAFLQRFVQAHSCVIHSIQFKPSHLPIYERITVSLYDADTDHSKPFRFCFLPSLTVALTDGANVLTEQMITSFWAALLRQGYYATQQLQQDLEPQLRRYFLSGITKDPSLPLSL